MTKQQVVGKPLPKGGSRVPVSFDDRPDAGVSAAGKLAISPDTGLIGSEKVAGFGA
jgi:hypothetical protein